MEIGEQLTERQLLEALLIPSGNNIARILAAQITGSDPAAAWEAAQQLVRAVGARREPL